MNSESRVKIIQRAAPLPPRVWCWDPARVLACVFSQKRLEVSGAQKSFSPLASASTLGSAVFCEIPVSCQQAALIDHFSPTWNVWLEIVLPWAQERATTNLAVFCRNGPPTVHVLLFCLHNHLLTRLRAMQPLVLVNQILSVLISPLSKATFKWPLSKLIH